MAIQITGVRDDRRGYIDGPTRWLKTFTMAGVKVKLSVAPMQYRGWRYAEGMFFVTAVNVKDGKSYRRKKTFKGERAYGTSRQLYDDLWNELKEKEYDDLERITT